MRALKIRQPEFETYEQWLKCFIAEIKLFPKAVIEKYGSEDKALEMIFRIALKHGMKHKEIQSILNETLMACEMAAYQQQEDA